METGKLDKKQSEGRGWGGPREERGRESPKKMGVTLTSEPSRDYLL